MVEKTGTKGAQPSQLIDKISADEKCRRARPNDPFSPVVIQEAYVKGSKKNELRSRVFLIKKGSKWS